MPACTERKVAVSNTPGVLDETTADFTWTLLMAVARTPVEADRLARSGEWRQWNLDPALRHRYLGQNTGHYWVRTHRPRRSSACHGISHARDLRQHHASAGGN